MYDRLVPATSIMKVVSAVVVRSEARGVEVHAQGDGRLTVSVEPEHVGEIAAAHGVVLHELTAQRATLEEVFLELTGEPGERGA